VAVSAGNATQNATPHIRQLNPAILLLILHVVVSRYDAAKSSSEGQRGNQKIDAGVEVVQAGMSGVPGGVVAMRGEFSGGGRLRNEACG
jgi:hypothetical protein